MRGLSGKKVLVTGGGSGIGAATAARFLEEGASVCVLDRSSEALERIGKELPDLSALLEADVADRDAVQTAFADAAQQMGTVDVLIMLEQVNRKIPLKRHAKPEEIAALFAFLASDDAAFASGHVYVMDGAETTGGLASQR